MVTKLKDSGHRMSFGSGMVREGDEGKPRYELCVPLDIDLEDQMFHRFAVHMANGAKKYSDRNWEKASGEEELERFKSSAFRHFMQWMCDEDDEDHAAAIWFNILAWETTKAKMSKIKEDEDDIDFP
jgi:hypothetical protein